MAGRDVLGVPLNYGGLIRRKLAVKGRDGKTIMQPRTDGKCDEEGNVIMVPMRQVVWTPMRQVFNNDFRTADEKEMRCFPYLNDDPFIEMHTTVLTEGKAVRKNKGLPVVIPPQF